MVFESRGQNVLKMIFLTSEPANKAEIAILSSRDTTRAWVPGRGIMGRNVGVHKNEYNTWLSSRPQNQPRSFRFVLFNFSLCCARNVGYQRRSARQGRNVHLIASFKELLKDTAGQIKRANDTSAELPMKEAKELKFREPLKFKRTARRTVQIQPSTAPSPLPRRPTSRK